MSRRNERGVSGIAAGDAARKWMGIRVYPKPWNRSRESETAVAAQFADERFDLLFSAFAGGSMQWLFGQDDYPSFIAKGLNPAFFNFSAVLSMAARSADFARRTLS